MKRKKVDFDKLAGEIRENQKDPEFMEIAKKFVIRHGGRIPSD